MYFNTEKENTNIDSEFNESTKSKFKLKYILIVFGVIAIIGILVFVVILLKTANKYSLSLDGEETIKIYAGTDYVEPGYSCFDKKGNDVTDKVIVNNQINTQVPGEYEITYTVNNITKTRIVTVTEKPIGATYIYLKGDLTIYLKMNEAYKEPGYIVIDTVDSNLSNQVKVNNTINSKKTGTYRVVYSVVNSSGVTTSAARTIIVVGSEISLSLSQTTPTNGSVNINVSVIDNYFDYMVLPNNTIVSSSTYTYKVTENGTYTFKSYNKKGATKESSIKVTNIDKTAPNGSCVLNITDEKSYITINITDPSGIGKYVYENKEYLATTINVGNEITSAKIIAYDKLGNNKSVTCTVNKTKSDMDGFILVGDSRFVGIEKNVADIKPSNVYFVAAGGMGYYWFNTTAIGRINAILKNNPGKKFYIYSNIGVNDIDEYNTKHTQKLNELAAGEWKNHKVGFVSINPCGGSAESQKSREKCYKTNDYNMMQKPLLNNVYYCDTYNAIGLGNFECISSKDCIHHSKKTNIEIYNYIINKCKF